MEYMEEVIDGPGSAPAGVGPIVLDFDDIDEYGELLAQQERIELVCLGKSKGTDRLELAPLPDVMVRHSRHSTPWHATGELIEDHVHFIVVLNGETGGRFLGHEVQASDILFQEGGREHHTMATGGEFIYLPVPNTVFKPFAQAWLGRPLPDTGAGQLLRPRPADAGRMQRTMRNVLHAVSTGEGHRYGAKLQADLLSAMVQPFAAQIPLGVEERWTHAERLNRFRMARDWIMDHMGVRFQLHDVCAATGMAERSLRRLFQEFVGMAPIPYIRQLRLVRARRLLKVGTPDNMSVKYAALDSGFWEVGRFCGTYQRTFGELPSATLTGH